MCVTMYNVLDGGGTPTTAHHRKQYIYILSVFRTEHKRSRHILADKKGVTYVTHNYLLSQGRSDNNKND